MAKQSALGFLESQISHIERKVYQTQYPFIQFRNLVPVSTEAAEWADSITHYSMDQVGQAEWFAANADSIPLADIQRNQHRVGVHMAGIGYEYNEEEIAQAMMVPGVNLPAEKAMAARRAAEERLDKVCLYGDSDFGWDGLLNNSEVDKSNAPDGAANSSNWDMKTPDEIIKDVNSILTGVYTDSLQVEMADTLLLPVALYTDIVSRRLTDSNGMTVYEFIMKANAYTGHTKKELNIMTVRGLENAAASNRGRIIAYRKHPEVLKFHLPMPLKFLPIWRAGPLVYKVPGIFRTGGLEVRLPGAMRYLDNVSS